MRRRSRDVSRVLLHGVSPVRPYPPAHTIRVEIESSGVGWLGHVCLKGDLYMCQI